MIKYRDKEGGDMVKVFIYAIVIITAVYIISKLLGVYPDSIEVNLPMFKIKIHNKEKRLPGVVAPKNRNSKEHSQ